MWSYLCLTLTTGLVPDILTVGPMLPLNYAHEDSELQAITADLPEAFCEALSAKSCLRPKLALTGRYFGGHLSPEVLKDIANLTGKMSIGVVVRVPDGYRVRLRLHALPGGNVEAEFSATGAQATEIAKKLAATYLALKDQVQTPKVAKIKKPEPKMPVRSVEHATAPNVEPRVPTGALVMFWGGLATLAAGGGLATWSYLERQQLSNNSYLRPNLERKLARMRGTSLGADIALTAGATAASAGLLWWLIADDEPVQLSFGPQNGGGQVILRGEF